MDNWMEALWDKIQRKNKAWNDLANGAELRIPDYPRKESFMEMKAVYNSTGDGLTCCCDCDRCNDCDCCKDCAECADCDCCCNCKNCVDCKNCDGCTNCEDCINCNDCHGQKGLRNQTGVK